MAKRTRTPPRAASAPAKPQGRQGRPGIVHITPVPRKKIRAGPLKSEGT